MGVEGGREDLNVKVRLGSRQVKQNLKSFLHLLLQGGAASVHCSDEVFFLDVCCWCCFLPNFSSS